MNTRQNKSLRESRRISNSQQQAGEKHTSETDNPIDQNISTSNSSSQRQTTNNNDKAKNFTLKNKDLDSEVQRSPRTRSQNKDLIPPSRSQKKDFVSDSDDDKVPELPIDVEKSSNSSKKRNQKSESKQQVSSNITELTLKASTDPPPNLDSEIKKKEEVKQHDQPANNDEHTHSSHGNIKSTKETNANDQLTDSDTDFKSQNQQNTTNNLNQNDNFFRPAPADKNSGAGLVSSETFADPIDTVHDDDAAKSSEGTASIDIIEVPESPPIISRKSPSLSIINVDDNETESDSDIVVESPIMKRRRRNFEENEVKFISEKNKRKSGRTNRNRRSKRNSICGNDTVILNSESDTQKQHSDSPPKRKTRSMTKVKKGQDSDSEDGQMLKRLLTNAHGSEVGEILEAWKTREGRRKLKSLDFLRQEGTSRKGRRTRNRRRLRKIADESEESGRSENDDSTESEDNSKPSKSQMATTRGAKRRGRESDSVLLPKASTLRDRLNGRRSLINDFRGLAHSKKNPNSIVKTGEQSQKGKSRRLRRKQEGDPIQGSESDEVLDEGRFEFASISNSDRSESEGDSILEEEEILEDEHVSGEDSEEENEKNSELEDDEEEDDDEHEEEEEEESEYEEPKPNRRRTRSMSQNRRDRRNLRRKRTQPRDVFEITEKRSKREQRERLEFLLQQSADISKYVHNAISNVTAKAAASPMKGKPKKIDLTSESGDPASNQEEQAEPNTEDGLTEIPKMKEEKFAEPAGDNKTLQPHQIDAVKWLLTLDAQGLNAILADEMGLGKTIQAIAFLASLVISGSRGPHLIIAPKNVCEHWADEVRSWYPDQLNVVTYLGPAEERLEILADALEEDNFDILITSYDHALKDLFQKKKSYSLSLEQLSTLRKFRKLEFEYLVVDEAHRLNNHKSKINIGIRKYDNAQRRLLLTGTPLSNKLLELWCLLNILNPRIFSDKGKFEEWFSAPFGKNNSSRNRLSHAEQSVIVDRLHTVVRPFFRRRVRADICPNFTSADEILIKCPMSTLQKALALHFTKRGKSTDAGMLSMIMALRGTCNHPYMASPALYNENDEHYNAKLISSSGKFIFLYHSLPRLLSSGHRVLIFSQFRGTLDLLEDLLAMLKIDFRRLDGMTSSDDRRSGLKAFTREGSTVRVMLLTTRAGGVGLNLQAADTVILFDSDWNPSADLQAVSRIQRIGQKKTVHIIRLMTDKSVEEIIIDVARNKLRTQALAVSAGKFHNSSGATVDHKTRQKQLEQVLEKLETDQYLGVIEVGSAASSNSDPNVTSALDAEIRDQTLEQWDKSLLRKGETSLKSVEQPSVWVDWYDGTNFSAIPFWLSPDANLLGTIRAMNTLTPMEAENTYNGFLVQEENVQTHGRQSRADRARRQMTDYTDLITSSDSESNREGDSDGSVEIEDVLSESSVENEIEKVDPKNEVQNQKDQSCLEQTAAKSAIRSPSSPAQLNEKRTHDAMTNLPTSTPEVIDLESPNDKLEAKKTKKRKTSVNCSNQAATTIIQPVPKKHTGSQHSTPINHHRSTFVPTRTTSIAANRMKRANPYLQSLSTYSRSTMPKPSLPSQSVPDQGNSPFVPVGSSKTARNRSSVKASAPPDVNVISRRSGQRNSTIIPSPNPCKLSGSASLSKSRFQGGNARNAPVNNSQLVQGNRGRITTIDLTNTPAVPANLQFSSPTRAITLAEQRARACSVLWTDRMDKEYWRLLHKMNEHRSGKTMPEGEFKDCSLALFELLIAKLKAESGIFNEQRLRFALINANGDMEKAKIALRNNQV